MRLYTKSEGCGPPLLLIHGIVSDHTFFDGITPYLTPYYRVTAYDRRGYGLEAEPAEDYSLDVQAEDARQALEGVTEPVRILAHSGGGRIALELARRYPAQVRSLVLVEPAFGCDPADGPRLARFHEAMADCAGRKKLLPALPLIAEAAGERSGRRKAPREGGGSLERTKRNLKNFMYGERAVLHGPGPDPEQLRRMKTPAALGISDSDGLYASVSRNDARVLGWPVFALPAGHNCLRHEPEACIGPLLRAMERLDDCQGGNENVGSEKV